MKFLTLMLVLVISACCQGCAEVIDAGHRGVEVTFGEVEDSSLPEGLYWYNPFATSINEIDVRTQKVEFSMETYTKDVQQATIKATVNINLDPATAHLTFKEVGIRWEEKLVHQVVEDALKQQIGKWAAEELISNRDKARTAAYEAIKERLAPKRVFLTGFELTNISYTPQFEKAVENKVVAIQQAIEEQNRTVQKQELADQVVIAAEADAQSIRIRANALAQNAKLVEWEAVQKWNGVLPSMMMGGQSVPFINIK
jgi:regulator of protease activity HflC (stomatin/prohibitin superfamily)